MIRVALLVFLSTVGGLLAAATFAVTIGPDGGLKTLTSPAVAEIAFFFGGLAGLLISPLMVWALHDKKLLVAVPCIYGLACSVVIILNIFSVNSSEFVALGVTVSGLFLYGLWGKRYPRLGLSDNNSK